MDILDQLQAEDKCVQLKLSDGNTVCGYADCIVYEEDDEGWDTVKMIRFEVQHNKFPEYYSSEDIIAFEVLDP